MKNKHIQVAFAAAVLLATGTSLAQAQTTTIKAAIAQKGAWTTSMVDYGTRQGFFKAEGLTVDTFWTQGGAPTLQAVISGSADVAIDTGLLGVISAYVKGAPLRIISASSTGGPDIYWYAKASSGIKTLKDAAGKSIGYSENGSSSNLILLSLLQYEHVQATPVAAGGMPANLTQVQTGQLAAGWAVPPFGLKEVGDKELVIIARGNDAPSIRNETVRVNVASTEALKTKRQAMIKFMAAYAKTINWAFSNPQAIDYFAEANHVSHDIAQKARDDFFSREQMQLGDIKGVPLALKQAVDYKYISHAMTPADIHGLFDIIAPSGTSAKK